LYASYLFLETTLFDNGIGGELVKPLGTDLEEGVY